MDYDKYNSELRKYFDEAIRIKESFYNAKKQLIEEHEVRDLVLKDTKDRYNRVHDSFNRGETNEDAFLQAKRDLEQAETFANELDKKLKELDHNQNMRLEKVIIKLKELKQKYEEEIIKEKEKLRLQLMKAKHEFLSKLIKDKEDYLEAYTEIREEYLDLCDEEYYLRRKSRSLGLETGMDIQAEDQGPTGEELDHSEETNQEEDNLDAPAIFMSEVWQRAGSVITDKELQDALLSGKISEEFEEELEKAMADGDS